MDTCMFSSALPILKAEQHMVGYVSRLPFGSTVFGANQDLSPQMLKNQTYTNLAPPSIESKYRFKLLIQTAELGMTVLTRFLLICAYIAAGYLFMQICKNMGFNKQCACI